MSSKRNKKYKVSKKKNRIKSNKYALEILKDTLKSVAAPVYSNVNNDIKILQDLADFAKSEPH